VSGLVALLLAALLLADSLALLGLAVASVFG